jgi:maleate cis-trans isomerase
MGTVGMIKPTTVGDAPIDDLFPFLPPGIAFMPVFIGVERGAMEEFQNAMPAYERNVEFLAGQGCDVIAAEGAPPFMVQGYRRETELIDAWQAKYKTPIFTSPQNHVNALRALGATRILGATYLSQELNQMFAKYFTDRGYTVVGFDEFKVPFHKSREIPSADVAEFIKGNFKKRPGADVVYILGSGWRITDIIEPLERELGVPVVHPVAARAWEIQRRLGLRHPVRGFGRLLAELPDLPTTPA